MPLSNMSNNTQGLYAIYEAIHNLPQAGGGSGDGGAFQVGTAVTKPSASATSITFNGLAGMPAAFAVLLKEGVSASSGYARTLAILYDGGKLLGQYLDSQSRFSESAWTWTYNNGTLRIASKSATEGGYLHAADHVLVYAYAADSMAVYDGAVV